MILWTEQFVILKQSSVAYAEQSLLQSVLQSTARTHSNNANNVMYN